MSQKFPSGRTVAQAKKDAKRIAKAEGISLHAAQDRVARDNGVDCSWGEAMARIKAQSGAAAPRGQQVDAAAFREVAEMFPELGAAFGGPQKLAGMFKRFEHDQAVMAWHRRAAEKGLLEKAFSEAAKVIGDIKQEGTGLRMGIQSFLLTRRAMAAAGDPYPGAAPQAFRHDGFEDLASKWEAGEQPPEDILDAWRRGDLNLVKRLCEEGRGR